jgi:hypothetical protein
MHEDAWYKRGERESLLRKEWEVNYASFIGVRSFS